MVRRRKGKYLFVPKVFLLLLLVLIGFLSYKVYIVSYEKYQINKEISNLDSELQELNSKSEDLDFLIDRLQDEDYLEREARKKLNFRKEGEKTVIITGLESGGEESEDNSTALSSDGESNVKKWMSVLFGTK